MKPEIIIMGAGGHAKVCIELLQSMGENVAYCIGRTNDSTHCLGIPVLKEDHMLKQLRTEGYQKIFIAIGSNQQRKHLAQLALKEGYQLVNAISPHAMVSPSAHLGIGVAIMAGAIINAQASISDLVIINTGASIDHDCQLNEASHIAPQCALAGHVTVGNQTFLGIGCKVIPKITIGNHVTIGAGSVVISDIASQVTAVGAPAKVIKNHAI